MSYITKYERNGTKVYSFYSDVAGGREVHAAVEKVSAFLRPKRGEAYKSDLERRILEELKEKVLAPQDTCLLREIYEAFGYQRETRQNEPTKEPTANNGALTPEEKSGIRRLFRGYDGRLTDLQKRTLRQYGLSFQYNGRDYWEVTDKYGNKAIATNKRRGVGKEGRSLANQIIKMIEGE